ncbi:MAG TPA: zeta toxin family protein [Longimicrobium sp.]|nr:zeta toxin family protein [Longimicrobium sp.]
MRRNYAIILAGPNGAGKSSFALDLLRHELDIHAFVNADLIAQALSPDDPDAVAIEAGRRMTHLITRLIDGRSDFAFETTLSGYALTKTVRRLIGLGYEVDLVYLWLPAADLAIQRVRSRVSLGGHSVPEDVIIRRYERSLLNFDRVYRKLVTSWRVYHAAAAAAGKKQVPLIAWGRKDQVLEVVDPVAWEQMMSWYREREGR